MICGVGGTVRAAGKLYNDIFDLSSSNSIMESEKLSRMLVLYEINSRDFSRRILMITPDRIHTIIPGMILLNIIAKKQQKRKNSDKQIWRQRRIFI